MLNDALLVLCTCPEIITAESLAKKMVEKRLAACVNIVPSVTSVYQWENETKVEPEVQLIIKTTSLRFNELKNWLQAEHPYEVPEIIALPIADGHSDYLNWVIKSTTTSENE